MSGVEEVREVLGAHFPAAVFGCECTPVDDESGVKECLDEFWEDHVTSLIAPLLQQAREEGARDALEPVRALADEWERATCITDGAPCSFHRYTADYAGDLRAAIGADE